MRVRAVLIISALAGSASASPLPPTELVQLFDQRCVQPIKAGKPGDTTGLEMPAGAEPLGSPRSEHNFKEIAKGVDLTLQSTSTGLHACTISFVIESKDRSEAVVNELTKQLGTEFKQLPSPCDTPALRSYLILERDERNPNGNLLGVLSFVISLPTLGESQTLVMAESDVPLTRHNEVCHE